MSDYQYFCDLDSKIIDNWYIRHNEAVVRFHFSQSTGKELFILPLGIKIS